MTYHFKNIFENMIWYALILILHAVSVTTDILISAYYDLGSLLWILHTI